MRINFYEEFPTKKNLAKLEFVTWPTTVYVAAKSIQEFKKIQESIKKKNVICGYWPILEKNEGYWITPFSSVDAVRKVIVEIKGNPKTKIMWDAELPFRRPWFFLRCDRYFRNVFGIKRFFKRYGKQIATSEYAMRNIFSNFILGMIGASFSPKTYRNKKIIMYYTSMHTSLSKHFLKNIERLYKKYGKNLHVGLGTIATGILGDEPILSPKNLERDLEDMKKIGIKEVVIFRLGGLNKEYINVLKKFI